MTTNGGASAPTGAFNRRQFIGGTAVLGLGTWLLGPDGLHQDQGGPLGTLLHQSARLLSVGFVVGGALAHGATVVPAKALRRPAHPMRGPAKVTVHGLTPGLSDPGAAGIDGIHVDALVPAGPHSQVAPFYAWTLRARPHAQSNPSSFAIDIDGRPRLGFQVDVRRAQAADPADAPKPAPARAVFATGGQAGMARLQPGTYLLGLEDEAWERTRTVPALDDETAWRQAGLTSLIVSIAA